MELLREVLVLMSVNYAQLVTIALKEQIIMQYSPVNQDTIAQGEVDQ